MKFENIPKKIQDGAKKIALAAMMTAPFIGDGQNHETLTKTNNIEVNHDSSKERDRSKDSLIIKNENLFNQVEKEYVHSLKNRLIVDSDAIALLEKNGINYKDLAFEPCGRFKEDNYTVDYHDSSNNPITSMSVHGVNYQLIELKNNTKYWLPQELIDELFGSTEAIINKNGEKDTVKWIQVSEFFNNDGTPYISKTRKQENRGIYLRTTGGGDSTESVDSMSVAAPVLYFGYTNDLDYDYNESIKSSEDNQEYQPQIQEQESVVLPVHMSQVDEIKENLSQTEKNIYVADRSAGVAYNTLLSLQDSLEKVLNQQVVPSEENLAEAKRIIETIEEFKDYYTKDIAKSQELRESLPLLKESLNQAIQSGRRESILEVIKTAMSIMDRMSPKSNTGSHVPDNTHSNYGYGADQSTNYHPNDHKPATNQGF